MKEKSKKKEEVEQLHLELEKTRNLFAASFQGIKVQEDFELRKQVRAAGGRYRVVANRLARVASQGTPAEPLLQGLKGMTSIVLADKDPVALAKALTAYAKSNPVFSFRAGLVEGKVVDVNQIAELASLPGKEAIYAKLLFLIQASAQRLVTVVGAVGRNLAVVVDQGVKEEKFKA
ncbi:MAG TPA: 50S ribosomal protein L10 [Bryobacterales bacterium]|nr:50S ribosomal protein L10 [Bryobacterales bacterium]